MSIIGANSIPRGVRLLLLSAPIAIGGAAMSAHAFAVDSSVESSDDSIADRHDARAAVRRDFALAELVDRLLPEAMSADRMRADASALALEPDDAEAWESLVESYRAEHEATGAFGADEVRRLLAIVWRQEDGELRPLPVPELLELRRAARRANDMLRSRDRAMLDALERMAPGETALDARATTYRRLVELNWRDLPPLASRVDLVELVDALELDDELARLVSEIVAAHRRAFVQAGDQRYEDVMSLEDLEAAVLVELGPAWRLVEDPAVVDDVDAQLADARADVLRASSEMARLNVVTLRELRRRLPDDPAARLARAWYERVRPELFSDQRAVERLFATAATTVDLDERDLETLELIPRIMLERTIPKDARRVEFDAEIARLRDAERDARDTIALEARLRVEAERARVDIERRAILRRSIDELLGVLGSRAQETSVVEDAAALRDRLRATDEVDRRHAEILDSQAEALAERRLIERRTAELFEARELADDQEFEEAEAIDPAFESEPPDRFPIEPS